MIELRWFLGVTGVLLTLAGVGLAWVLRGVFDSGQLYSHELAAFIAGMVILLAGLIWPQQRLLLMLGVAVGAVGLIAVCWMDWAQHWPLALYLPVWLVYAYLSLRGVE